MQPFHDWSIWRILFMSVAWVMLAALFMVAWAMFRVYRIRRAIAASGSGGIAAVSVGLLEWSLWLVVLPPFVLLVVWVMAR